VHQLVNKKNFDNIKMQQQHGMDVEIVLGILLSVK
jgi:hypothetical protein